MSEADYIVENHRNLLPHKQEKSSITFITWRLAFTVPTEISSHLKEHNGEPDGYYLKYLEKDSELGSMPAPDFSLNDPDISKIITGSLLHGNDRFYELHAYCIMSNHVHILIRALNNADGKRFQISKIMQRIKGFTGMEINKLRGTQGQVWDHVYFDRNIRNCDDYCRVVEYILNNPVKAGLVGHHSQWKDSYYHKYDV